MKYSKVELMFYLEDRLHWDEATDEEYGFYLDYKRFGKQILIYEDSRRILRYILKNMRDECNGIFEEDNNDEE